VSDIAVISERDAPLAILRYQARISFDDGPGFTCWHTDCYRRVDQGENQGENQGWQVIWSQATQIIGPEQAPKPV
jgi:hypothetical protein